MVILKAPPPRLRGRRPTVHQAASEGDGDDGPTVTIVDGQDELVPGSGRPSVSSEVVYRAARQREATTRCIASMTTTSVLSLCGHYPSVISSVPVAQLN